MFVEDDDDIREVVLEDLEERGYLVQGMTNGSAALEALRQRGRTGSDVTLVLDLMMPEMDGWELLRELRNDIELGKVHVVVTTGVEDAGTLPSNVQVLRKPYTIGELVRAIERSST
jgi:CheY-like chemotaxis protein